MIRSQFLVNLLAATASTLLFAPAFGQAAEPEVLSADEALAIDAKHYAASYGVSVEEAAERLLIMHESGEQIAQIAQRYRDRLSGIYFDSSGSFGLAVRVTGNQVPTNERLVRRPSTLPTRASGRVPGGLAQRLGLTEGDIDAARSAMGREISREVRYGAQARNTRRQRVALQDQARAALLVDPQIEMIADDERTGQAIIYVLKADDPTRAKVAAALGDEFRMVEIPTGIVATHSRGGSKLRKRSDNGLWCMTAFPVKKNFASIYGAVTAGHCLDGAPPLKHADKADGNVYDVTSEPNWRNDSSFDLGWVSAGHHVTNQFYADSGTAARTITSYANRLYDTRVKSTTVTGSYICHLGQTSKTNETLVQSCGEVTSVSGGSQLGGNTFVVVSNTQSGPGTTRTSGLGTLRCVRGDSGGPWFANTVAYGVQSGCSWTDSTETTAVIVVYSSVDFISQLDVQIQY